MTKVIFMGTPLFSVPILEALNRAYDVVLVVTQPADRGNKGAFTPVQHVAQTLGIPCMQPGRIRDQAAAIVLLRPDVIVTAAYGQILPKTILDASAVASVNIHASLLPKLRGGAPVQRAIQRRHAKSGISIIEMVEKMDAGGVYAQREIELSPEETGTTLFDKVSLLGRDLLMETLPGIIAGERLPVPQDETRVTYAYNIKPDEERLDFRRNAADVEAKVRAFNETPGTYVKLPDGRRMKIRKAAWNDEDRAEKPGTVIEITEQGIHVQCKPGTIILEAVQPAGKKTMSASDFMHGRGRRLLKRGVVLDENTS